MKTIELKTIVHQYDSIDDLNEDFKNLMMLASEATKRAYAPYSGFNVGAALLLENGEIVTGNNQENIAYPSGLCAERVAIFNAGAKYPDTPITAIAITANSKNFKVEQPVSPCGACRQVISEYELKHDNNIKIILMGESGEVYVINSMKELLPLVFNEVGLKK